MNVHVLFGLWDTKACNTKKVEHQLKHARNEIIWNKSFLLNFVRIVCVCVLYMYFRVHSSLLTLTKSSLTDINYVVILVEIEREKALFIFTIVPAHTHIRTHLFSTPSFASGTSFSIMSLAWKFICRNIMEWWYAIQILETFVAILNNVCVCGYQWASPICI